MKSTAILTLCCGLLLVALGWVSTVSVERIDSLNAQLAQVSKNFADCSAALKSARSATADLLKQGKTSQANCIDSLVAAQGLFELALPSAPVKNAPEVSDAAFTDFLNTF